jgi:hypothetical protein
VQLFKRASRHPSEFWRSKTNIHVRLESRHVPKKFRTGWFFSSICDGWWASFENFLKRVLTKYLFYTDNSPFSCSIYYRCELCQKSFRHKQVLRSHMTLHLGKSVKKNWKILAAMVLVFGINGTQIKHFKKSWKPIVYSFSSDPEGEWKNCQRVLKFLPLIFGSETSKQMKWVRNVRVDYRKNLKLKIWSSEAYFNVHL